MPGFQLHDSRWDFPGPQPNLKRGGSVAQSCLTLVTPWTVARQASLSMGFSRQEYWSGLPFQWLPYWTAYVWRIGLWALSFWSSLF